MSFNNSRRPSNRPSFKRPTPEPRPQLDLKALRLYLEAYFGDKKDEIAELNKLRTDPSLSIFYRTYSVEWPFERGNQNIRITIYRDLPSPYPEELCSTIKQYLRDKGFDADCRFWHSFADYKSLDPGRILRN